MDSPPPPPSSPPPSPPPMPPVDVLPSSPEMSWARADPQTTQREELDAPARLLCRMSIAALLEADIQTSDVSTTSSRTSPTIASMDDQDPDEVSPLASPETRYTTDSDGDVRIVHELAPRTPISSLTQEKLHRLRLKRPPTSSVSDLVAEMNMEEEHLRRMAQGSLWKRHSHQPSPASLRGGYGPDYAMQDVSPMRPSLFHQTIEREAVGTLVVYQPTCLDHHNDTHQENRERLSVLCGPQGILQKPRFRSLKWANLRELKPARLNDVLRVHSFQYIRHLERLCDGLPEQNDRYSVGPLYLESHRTASKKDKSKPKTTLSPLEWMKTEHAKRCYEVTNPPSSGLFDTDSPISRRSYDAARLAAGAVCHAIDKVVRRETKNAFVVVRPPGHHAGPNGCVESEGFHRRPEMCTCGFCLLNNVAIGAGYAMSTYSTPYYSKTSPSRSSSKDQGEHAEITRIAIVDFDIHHGNGTEEIIRNLVPHDQKYPLPSSWAPLSFPSYKPWRDENDIDNVFFSSIHLFDEDNFYPCSGKGPQGDSAELQQVENILNLPLSFLGPKYLEEREKLTVKAKKALMDQASRQFREKVSKKLVPALRAFQPDLILLSAGFDGHADDFYYYLTEDDYAWVTTELTGVADECCEGRLVSVLEGGYNVEVSQKRRQGKSKKTNQESGDTESEQREFGSLARSCAAHVAALHQAASS
ncbi:hypothetical protein Poli38472_013187 [Pythium oligandrum]|uniref:Histone deacetylase domain-containing protein n=1 Tax=Pythium oligandrum TaxID=41045 RepID=A0A8K1C2K1_PYTOL|nr:hypothetical protein Poli38472_013187 [Pythium oligandrum]|eukprot:TMW55296.1 hypothetical protein Poli38472_013187 [Pythium oligandrum]